MRFFLCLLCASPLLAAHAAEVQFVDVIVPAVRQPMIVAVYHAEGIAAQIYSEIGVRLRWPRALHGREPLMKPMHCTIVVAFSWNTPSTVHPGALALSNPYAAGGAAHVTLFMDRVEPMVDSNPVASAFLLGHVLAHEMAHVLQRINRHSDTGVLKAHWSEMEIRSMQLEHLRFTHYDAALIFQGMRSCAAGERQ